MWNVHGVQLNLGVIVGTDHGICSWSDNDYTFTNTMIVHCLPIEKH